MKFVLALIKVSATLLVLGLLFNYLYFAYMTDSSSASGWALGLLMMSLIMCTAGYAWGWNMTRKSLKSPLDEYIADVHKEEELLQKAAAVAPLASEPKESDTVTPVLEKLVAANTKNTTMLNLAMENLNARLDDLEDKFIRRQTAGIVPENTATIPTPDEPAAPSGYYDEEFAGISDLEIMKETPENEDEYEEIDLDTLIENAKKIKE